MAKKTKKTWLWEFSKRLMVAVTIIYVIAIIYSEVFMFFYPDSTAINGFVTDISDVFKYAVISYAVKAGFENVVKIYKYPREDDV
jgi:hypothetical protein